MSGVIRPMLADNKPFKEAIIQRHLDTDGFLIMQPKIDGMRVLFHEQAMSRSWKPHKNKYVQQFLAENKNDLFGQDGEIISGHTYSPEVFRESMSGIRAEDGSPEFSVYLFDNFDPRLSSSIYERRRESNQNCISVLGNVQGIREGRNYSAKLILCPQWEVRSLTEIYAKEDELLKNGWEGGILRRPFAPYKYGRSTALEGALAKVKRWKTADAIVTGYEPWYENQNEATTSELGYTTRTVHQENLVPMERLGALRCKLVDNPAIEFKCGVFLGLSHTDRDNLWTIRDSLIGRHFEFKDQDYDGGYSAPRTPVWLRWRSATEF